MLPEPQVCSPDELRVGRSAEFEQDVTEADVLDFARTSGDFNPLHVDAAYAGRSNFRGRIAHGAYQIGLASALLGMYLPGKRVLLVSVNARFPAPLYFPGRVKVRGEITSWNREQLAGQLKAVVLDKASRIPTAEILLGFTFHGKRGEQASAASHAFAARSGDVQSLAEARKHATRSGQLDQPVVLVTGAAGGIGSAVVAELAKDFSVLAGVNRQRLSEELRGLDPIEEVEADLGRPGWEDAVRGALGDRPLYGIVHAAWPGAPHGGLLDAQDEVIDAQVAFGTTYTVRLARLLAAHCDSTGGRLIVLGSMTGSRKPVVSRAAYSLGKAALEQTVKLLAPELARKQITVNAIAPSFVPAGMNQQSPERQLKLEAAQVPLGRLCTPHDVAQVVRYVLSPAAAFVSGQFLGLTGGQL